MVKHILAIGVALSVAGHNTSDVPVRGFQNQVPAGPAGLRHGATGVFQAAEEVVGDKGAVGQAGWIGQPVPVGFRNVMDARMCGEHQAAKFSKVTWSVWRMASFPSQGNGSSS